MRKLLVAAALLAALPAQAQNANRPDLIRALCHKDGCDEFTVRDVQRLDKIGNGEMFSFLLHAYKASRSGRADRGEAKGYVYCSRTRPALMSERDGKIGAVLIAPYSRERPDQIRLNSNYSAIYFTICHGQEAGRIAAHDVAAAARQYGYEVRRPAFRLTGLGAPEEAADQE